jgi:CHAD domain-containing protein
MRVATRRLRSMMRSFSQVLRSEDCDGLGHELAWLGDVLGAARDAEVLDARLQQGLQRLRPELVLGPVAARVRTHFGPAEKNARAAVLEALDSDRYLTLLDRLDGLLAGPPLTPEASLPAAEVLLPAVRHARRRLRRRMRRARKAAKHARYAAEAVSAAFGKPARRFAKSVQRVQSALGDHHDGVVARVAIWDLGEEARLAGEDAFSFGVLYEQEAGRGRELEDQAQRAWKRASRPKFSAWLG